MKNVEIITVTSKCVSWRLKSTACRVFAQPFVQAHIKENIKDTCYGHLCGVHQWPVDSTHKEPRRNAKNVPFDDVIMICMDVISVVYFPHCSDNNRISVSTALNCMIQTDWMKSGHHISMIRRNNTRGFIFSLIASHWDEKDKSCTIYTILWRPYVANI